MAKKKKSALAAAASRRLAQIGAPDPYEITHALFHAEQEGRVQRVTLDDGTWAWAVPDPKTGQSQLVKPTPEMLGWIAEFESSHHHH